MAFILLNLVGNVRIPLLEFLKKYSKFSFRSSVTSFSSKRSLLLPISYTVFFHIFDLFLLNDLKFLLY